MRFLRCLDIGSMFLVSRHPRKTCFHRARFPLVPGRPMGFRGVWTPDSCSPHRDCSEKLVSDQLDFHWFPVDQWGFEVNGRQIRVPHIQLPLTPCSLFTLTILADNFLLTSTRKPRKMALFWLWKHQYQQLWTRNCVQKIDTLNNHPPYLHYPPFKIYPPLVSLIPDSSPVFTFRTTL